MKLFHSPTSPFVRKVRIVAHETGLADRIELLTCAAGPINRDTSIVAHNPLGQVPTLLTDDDRVLADSRVICEFLDTLGKGTLFPRDGDARWQALADQSAADGLLDAALLLRYETFMRPEALRWDGWIKGQFEKVHSVLATFEARAMTLENRVRHRHHYARLRHQLSRPPVCGLGLAETGAAAGHMVQGIRQTSVDDGDAAPGLRTRASPSRRQAYWGVYGGHDAH